MTPKHQPVLFEEVLRLLDPQPGESYLDLTAGFGGHAAGVLARTGEGARAVLVDRDIQAIKHLNANFRSAEIIHANYLQAVQDLLQGGSLFDMILLDLGVSSPQLDDPQRGFSFRESGPLDMRMDQSQPLSADDVVNGYLQAELQQILRQYGEEPRARAVAKAIVEARPIKTTGQLAEIVRASAARTTRIDAATRTFQAIRMEVNQELLNLKETLPLALRLLTPGGRLAVISFHSLEDRIVKNFLKEAASGCQCPPKQPVCTCDKEPWVRILTKRAIKGEEYDDNNPRARSAKLRAAVKLRQKQKGGEA